MKTKTLRSDIMLLVTSAIWGFAFVAQRSGMNYVGPFTFNGIRFLLGSVSLVPLIVFLKRINEKKARVQAEPASRAPVAPPLKPKGENLTLAAPRKPSAVTHISSAFLPKQLFTSSLILGVVLFTAASLQQIGLKYTEAGKAGFITGLYVVLVPIFGIGLRHKTGIPTWIGAVLALIGLYFLSVYQGIGSINRGDVLVAVGAVFWAAHVLLIDYFSKRVDPIQLSAGQFAWCALGSLAVAFLTEPLAIESIRHAAIPILYGGLGSVGVAYTLQVVAQKDAPPAHSAILLSLEGLFAVIGGILLLSEKMTMETFIGCAFIFAGMMATQWEVLFSKK